MYGLKEMLMQEKNYLDEIIEKACAGEKSVPKGKLRISMNRGKARYYHCINDRYGEYISKENNQLPRQLAQKSYNEAVVKAARARAKIIAKCLEGYCDDEIEQIYEGLHEERKSLITPIIQTCDQLEEQWYSIPYISKSFREETPEILSERGERVRSKSEKILADFFYRNNILYKYEKPLNLAGYGTVYPDFTFYSKRLRKEIYWEHEGMMDNPEYARNAVKKLNSYQMNGIYPGERLILTFETDLDVLNSRIVKELVDKYLR